MLRRGAWSDYALFPGSTAHVLLLSEAALYKLVMRSDKPHARDFQTWAANVLVTIRKTGSYVMGEERLNDPSLSLSDLDAINEHIQGLMKRKADLLEARVLALTAEKEAAEATVTVMAPKVELVDQHFAANGNVKLARFVRGLDAPGARAWSAPQAAIGWRWTALERRRGQ